MEDLTRTTLILSGIYILLGLICMVVVEFTFSLLRMRSRMLKETMRVFLEGSAEAVFNHPLLRSYGPFFNYLSPGILSAALSDYLMLQGRSADGSLGLPREGGERNFQNLRVGIESLPGTSFQYALIALLTMTSGTVEDFGSKIENWFEDVINQVTGAYKLRAFCALCLTAFCLSAATNADTLAMANILWAREAPAQAATLEKGRAVQPLIGWEAQFPRQPLISKVFGISFTAIVVALFAMLLFDGLNSVTNVRFTGPRPGRERKARAKIDVSSEG